MNFDERKREMIFPVRIVDFKNADNCAVLLVENNLQLILPEVNTIAIKKGGYVIVDFGREVYGSVRILTGDIRQSCKIRIRTGESVSEASAELGEKNSGNNHSVRDCEYPAPSHCDLQTGLTGFRFTRIDLVSGGTVNIKSVVAESVYYDLEKKGSFECDDALINKIYQTAAYTAHLCIQNNVVWDGIKRDRAVWIGDLHPEMMAISQVFGCIPQLKNSLDTMDVYIADNAWANHIPAYSVWWIICLNEYYLISGDRDYIIRGLPKIKHILSCVDNIIDSGGNVSYKNSTLKIFEGNEFFFDWPTNFTPDSQSGWEALVVFGLKKALRLLEDLGENTELCQKTIDKILKKPLKQSAFKQVAAMRHLADMEDINQADCRVLTASAKGMTGFMGYYILSAACGLGKNVLPAIKEFYGGMLKMGATTFWEDFNIDWLKDNPCPIDQVCPPDKKDIHGDFGAFCYTGFRHSLCHGWTAGILPFLTQYVLGVQPVEAGYKKCRIAPNLMGLSYAKGKVPTPYGVIEVEHKYVDGNIVSTVNCPKEIEYILQ